MAQKLVSFADKWPLFQFVVNEACDERRAFLKTISYIYYKRIQGIPEKSKLDLVAELATKEFGRNYLFTQVQHLWKEEKITHENVQLKRFDLFFCKLFVY